LKFAQSIALLSLSVSLSGFLGGIGIVFIFGYREKFRYQNNLANFACFGKKHQLQAQIPEKSGISTYFQPYLCKKSRWELGTIF
jgi:hypothetical protein